MGAENSPIDLNSLPEDFPVEVNVPVFEAGSSSLVVSGWNIMKNSNNNVKEECKKVYECRFCSLKFRKSQALGGHMNRHRQEREIEAMNRALQMVFGVYDSNNIVVPHLGFQSPRAYPLLSSTGGPSLAYRSSVVPPHLLQSPFSSPQHQSRLTYVIPLPPASFPTHHSSIPR